MRLLRKIGSAYLGFTALLVVLKATGLAKTLVAAFDYTLDVAALVFLVAAGTAVAAAVRKDADKRKKARRVYLTAFLSPLVLIVVFKYLLLIPMPKEGGIMDLMNLVYYSLK
jgi:uncharacterized membrane protein YozB (DUF420 family)